MTFNASMTDIEKCDTLLPNTPVLWLIFGSLMKLFWLGFVFSGSTASVCGGGCRSFCAWRCRRTKEQVHDLDIGTSAEAPAPQPPKGGVSAVFSALLLGYSALTTFGATAYLLDSISVLGAMSSSWAAYNCFALLVVWSPVTKLVIFSAASLAAGYGSMLQLRSPHPVQVGPYEVTPARLTLLSLLGAPPNLTVVVEGTGRILRTVLVVFQLCLALNGGVFVLLSLPVLATHVVPATVLFLDSTVMCACCYLLVAWWARALDGNALQTEYDAMMRRYVGLIAFLFLVLITTRVSFWSTWGGGTPYAETAKAVYDRRGFISFVDNNVARARGGFSSGLAFLHNLGSAF